MWDGPCGKSLDAVISFKDIGWSAVAGDEESKKSPGDP